MTSGGNEGNNVAGTTEFLNEAIAKRATRDHALDVPQGLMAATRVGYVQEIKDFLAKPVVCQTALWSNQAAGSILLDHKVPEDELSQTVFAQKVAGFVGFRAKTVLRLQVNGNRFQAGRLLMVFIPQGAITDTYPDMRTRSLMAATQLPRVELDLSDDTEVLMEIPYIAPTPFYNRLDGTGAMGRVRVIVYSPLATGAAGDANVNMTLWCHFEDVELVAPTAQAGDNRPRRRKNPSDQEIQAISKPISGGLQLASQAAGSFAQIPLLKPVAGVAKWALEAAAGVAAAFGYSKPVSEEAVTKVCPNFQFHLQNHNGMDYFPHLGLDASNKLQVLPGLAGTNVDEMSLSHLVQIPAFYTNASWSLSMASGSNIFFLPTNPLAYNTAVTINSWPCYDTTPLAFFSSFFEYWRGSLIYTFKFVKTNFHSGRLLFTYDPNSTAMATVTSSAYLLREVMDIRYSNEFRFAVPFVSTQQYRQTMTLPTADGTSASGSITLQVLNELVAPESVSSTVDIIMEVSAGPDFELAFPRPHGIAPIINSAWSAQAGDPTTIPAINPSTLPERNSDVVTTGSAVVVPPILEPAQYCIGEKVNSILQLMKRYTTWTWSGANNTTFTSIGLRPFANGAYITTDVYPTSPPLPTSDYISIFSLCFAYVRGGVRILAAWPTTVYGQKAGGWISIYPDETTTTVIQGGGSEVQNFNRAGLALNMQPSFAGILPTGATIPPYQKLHARLARVSTSSANEPNDIYTTPVRCLIDNNSNVGATKVQIFRAAGDDFSLGYFLGTPLITLPGV